MKNLKLTTLTETTQKQNYFRIVGSSLFILLANLLSAQDVILMKDGSEVQAKIIEINDLDVKYKKADYTTGPTYSARKTAIFYVKYENGTKDVFNEQPDIMKSTYVDPLPAAPNMANKYDPDTSDFAKKKRKSFSGPRVGLSYVGSGTTANYLNNEGKNPFLTQFGWQFEGRLFTIEDGTSGLIEFVPLVGGIEQGMFLPSASFLLGLRSGRNSSWEFALGPNFGLKADHNNNIVGAMSVVLAVGTSFKRGNVWFPVNLAFVPSVGTKETVTDPLTHLSTEQKFNSGYRVALLVGFNSRRR
ncbi:MAG: hypothetical protein PSX36_15090 [bacterium]|nr:hypothetical protein [bacterium]